MNGIKAGALLGKEVLTVGDPQLPTTLRQPIPRSNSHRRWLRPNFATGEGQEPGHRLITPSIREMSAKAAGQREWAWLFVLWATVTAYNLFKPYHIDDTAHLEIARWIGAHPLRPMSGLVDWEDGIEPIYQLNQPHLYFYLLAVWGGVFGYSEVAMHLLQSLASLCCILLFHHLARRFVGPAALWATAMLVLGPAFVVEQNLMVDVPLLATWLAFFNLLICDIASPRQKRRYILAAFACAAALLIKYSSLTLLVILCLSLLLERRRAQAWTVLIPIVALAVWSLFNFLDYGGVHIASRGVSPDWPQLEEAVAWVLALGALTPLGLIALIQSRQELVRAEGAIYALTAVGLGAMIFAVAFGVLSNWWSDRLLWLLFITNGTFIYLALIPDVLSMAHGRFWRPEVARAFGPRIYLALWVFGTTAFYVRFSPFVAARHVLLILPPLTLLLFSRWSWSLTWRSRSFALCLTLIVSAGLCLSDWRFAEFYKSEAAKLAQTLSTTGNVWFSGHFGWQWYATQNGFHEVDAQFSHLRPGDFLVAADDLNYENMNVPHMRLVRTDRQGGPLLNLFCTGRNARFYISDYKTAPWSLSRDCVKHLTVFQILGIRDQLPDSLEKQ
jgi:4-amino-4-deoxy-L-arabinose transferase-like glycosyltransferase